MLSQHDLKKIVIYDPETGLFTRTVNRGRAKSGDVAGGLHVDGYIQISINNKLYKAHRLAFLYMEGDFPSDQVDHINRVRNDNRWDNLRHSDQRLNMNNKENNTVFVGVGWNKRSNKWRATGNEINGLRPHLGYFKTHFAACYAKHAHEAKYVNQR